MNSSFKSALVAAAVISAGIANAQAADMYVGGAVGAPDYSSSINGIGGGGGGNGTSLNVYGGYNLTPNFAVEAGWFSLGKTSDANGSADTRGVYLDGVGIYTFAPQWSVLGSAGVAQANFSTDLGNDSSSALKLGAGVQYQLTPSTALRVKYDRYMFTGAFGDRPNVGELSVGLNIGF